MRRSDGTEREVELDRLLDEADGDADGGSDRSHRVSNRERSGDASGRSRLDGVRSRVGRIFSVKVFLVALVLSVVGLAAGRSVPILGGLPVVGDAAGYVGVFVAGFVVGVATARGRYVETALAGAIAAGLGFVLSSLLLTVATDVGPVFAAVGATGGAAAALLGAYLGNDLRDGLTRPVE